MASVRIPPEATILLAQVVEGGLGIPGLESSDARWGCLRRSPDLG